MVLQGKSQSPNPGMNPWASKFGRAYGTTKIDNFPSNRHSWIRSLKGINMNSPACPCGGKINHSKIPTLGGVEYLSISSLNTGQIQPYPGCG
jgi:hypothetical protein